VILVFVRRYESLKVFILVQQRMAGRGRNLCAGTTWEKNIHNIKFDDEMGGGMREWHGTGRYSIELEKDREITWDNQ
jgi:hypothetical protein